MDYIYRSWVVQIDITSVCGKHCIYCTRYLGHVSAGDRYVMSPEQFSAVLDSLEGWPNVIGIMGGEPLLHPQFREIVALARRRVPREKLQLWTSGLPGTPQEDPRADPELAAAFGAFHYNPHNAAQLSVCRHQPLTIAVDEAVPDKGMMWKLINDCWLPRLWAPSVIAAGAYFCEVAGPLDAVLHNGAHAWKVEAGWWKRPPEAFQEQVSELCPRCGMCLPMKRQHLIEAREKFTPGLAADFRKKGAIRLEGEIVEVRGHSFDNAEIVAAAEDWYPANYRDDLKTDQALPAREKGIQTRLEPDPGDPLAFRLDDEAAFNAALARIRPLRPEEDPLEFSFYYKGFSFKPLREPYPFVLPEHPEENLLYFRCLLLHYKQILDEDEFSKLRAASPEPGFLATLAQRYRGKLEERLNKIYENWGKALNGQEAYFWGHGAAWRHFRRHFAGARPRCFLVDAENGACVDSRVDGIPVRHPRDVLLEGGEALPSVMFARQEFAEEWSRAVRSKYAPLLAGELMLCRLG
ncbi:MAG: radical SAM protein [Deltaproteobacteria bacterium]|jgi:hypothetical protein|nr:radical SAM protein [Deltaproteobacteria bacterium]